MTNNEVMAFYISTNDTFLNIGLLYIPKITYFEVYNLA